MSAVSGFLDEIGAPKFQDGSLHRTSTEAALNALRVNFWGKSPPEGLIWDLGDPGLMRLLNLKWSRGRLSVLSQYPPFLDLVGRKRAEADVVPIAVQGLLLTGDSGTGKTSCLFYLAVNSLCNKQDVVLYHSNRLYAITETAVYTLDTIQLASALEDTRLKGALCLIDLDWPLAMDAIFALVLSSQVACFRVAASPPNPERYKNWQKQATIGTYVFGTPTRSDFQNLFRLFFPDVGHTELDIRFYGLLDACGTNIRDIAEVMADESPDGRQESVEQHIEDISTHLQQLHDANSPLQLFAVPDALLDHSYSHSLIHTYGVYAKDPARMKVRHRIRSTLILKLLLKAYQSSRLRQPSRMNDLFTSSSLSSVSRGWVFEILCHEKLCIATTLAIVPLIASDVKPTCLVRDPNAVPTSVPVGKRDLEIYSSGSIVSSTASPKAYYVPAEGNNPTFDAFLHVPGEPGVGFQMFIERSRSVKRRGMALLRKRLAAFPTAKDDLRFVFVVPSGSDFHIDVGGKFRGVKFFMLEVEITQHTGFEDGDGDDDEDEVEDEVEDEDDEMDMD
ncbi:hypothetical protein B0H15DRAFT_854525 [Mycena belliarum]|uniref:Uncharacterized protein n=1 Tax=Mycena belliarum TaxID=1033014 RepID=A0AAD6XMD1_9AGAR|nr:hypothetical protein B0H15DRAFT_854525 [Mycena belliae]